jgi:hypothetical protein
MASQRNTILLDGEALERRAFARPYVLIPGMLVALSGDDVAPAQEGAKAAIFVRSSHENEGGSIDDEIAIDDEAILLYPGKASVINALTDETIARGDELAADEDGKLRLAHPDEAIIAWAAGPSVLPDAANLAIGAHGRVPVVPA